MSQVLSQDEVDALLKGVAGDQPKPAEQGKSELLARDSQAGSTEAVAEMGRYDFTRAENSSIARLPGLEVIYSNFSRRLQSMFASELGKSVDINFLCMEVLSYEI